jgi:hypothetical protein
MPLCSRHVPASRVRPMSQPIRPAVSLCVPTFRRPDGLRNLLSHVARLDYQGPLSVIVVDNDADQLAGEAVVRAMAPGFPFPLTCVVEPRRGQTYACNTAFAAACRAPATDYVAVLDDDEYPAPTWLAEMIATAIRYEADIVGGPVFPVFEDPDHWLARGGLYAPRRFVTGRVEMIYGAGTMLIRRDVLAHYLDEPFSHAPSSAAATMSFSSAAAAMDAALRGPTTPACSRRPRAHARRRAGYCCAISARAPRRPASIDDIRRGGRARSAAGAPASA